MSISRNSVKVGVVGVGHLGSRHLEHLQKIPEVLCPGFYDIDPERANLISRTSGAKQFGSLEALIEESDALTIAVPTRDHFSVATVCIGGGKHVLIEKPICKTIQEADRLLVHAREKSVLVQVGHIERLNPALLALNGVVLAPRYIETHRLAPYVVRGTDVPVVLDLMIHDLDVILSLVKSPVKSVHASGVSIMTKSVDIANARLRFENGCVANITSSRIAKDYVRKLRIFQQDMYVTIDFLMGLTEVYRILEAHEKDPNAVVSAPLEGNHKHRQIVYEMPEPKKRDALRLELENFVRSVQGLETPIVTGEEGREALRIASIIQEKIEQDIH
ncbi:MAG: Gfo/Idh/MocA family oxidoreductase [Fidelibacterota bacterium]